MKYLIQLLPVNTQIKFLNKRLIALAFSGLLILASAGSLFTQGLNFGIDFAGGTLIEIKTPGPADMSGLRTQLSGLGVGEVALQSVGDADDLVMIRVQKQEGGEEAELAAIQTIKDSLGDEVDYRRTEFVGPKVGEELVMDGLYAVIFSILAIVAYITFRFEFYFGVGAMIALVHDVITTVGMFSLLGMEFNLTTVAALLTIAGYSINDTVVVFDRVRENMRRYRKRNLEELLDLSLNEMLSRTLLTSGTTLLAVTAIYIFGGEVLSGFAFALIWGVVIGTFSSIYIALPMLLYFNVKTVAGAEDDETPDQGDDGDGAAKEGAKA